MNEVNGETVPAEKVQRPRRTCKWRQHRKVAGDQRVAGCDAEQQHAGPGKQRHVVLRHRLARHESEPAKHPVVEVR